MNFRVLSWPDNNPWLKASGTGIAYRGHAKRVVDCTDGCCSLAVNDGNHFM